ncbi:MAG: hypothetical protein WA888_03170 [Burkholderiaceae bacterium]
MPYKLTDGVLAETVWTLTGKKYGLDRDEIVQVLLTQFEEASIAFEDSPTAWRALSELRLAQANRPASVGFRDTLTCMLAGAKAP